MNRVGKGDDDSRHPHRRFPVSFPMTPRLTLHLCEVIVRVGISEQQTNYNGCAVGRMIISVMNNCSEPIHRFLVKDTISLFIARDVNHTFSLIEANGVRGDSQLICYAFSGFTSYRFSDISNVQP